MTTVRGNTTSSKNLWPMNHNNREAIPDLVPEGPLQIETDTLRRRNKPATLNRRGRTATKVEVGKRIVHDQVKPTQGKDPVQPTLLDLRPWLTVAPTGVIRIVAALRLQPLDRSQAIGTASTTIELPATVRQEEREEEEEEEEAVTELARVAVTAAMRRGTASRAQEAHLL